MSDNFDNPNPQDRPAEQRPYSQQGPTPPPFGGGYAGNPQPRKPGNSFFTCLIVLSIMVFLLVVGFFLIAVLGSTMWRGGSKPAFHGSNSVALVRIDGAIMDSEKIIEVIHHYRDSDSIRAILVRVDSPGGAVAASQEVYEALKELHSKAKKKVVVSMGNVAASGGYYLSCGAERIYANPGTLTGSIGVIMGLPNVQDLSKKVGVQYESVKSGKFKDIGSVMRPLSDDERKLLQGVIGDTYEQFLEAIVSQRKAQLDEAAKNIGKTDPAVAAEIGPEVTGVSLLRAVADGRVFTGRKAHDYGLVDELGTETDALNYLAKSTNIVKPKIYEYKPVRSWRDVFESSAKSAIDRVASPGRGARLEYSMPF